MDFIKAFFGVIAALGALSLPAAAVYMMLGIGAEAFAHADLSRSIGTCPSTPVAVEHSEVIG